MSTLLHVLAGLGIAIIAIPPSILISIILIRANMPLVLPGSIGGPVIVALIAYAVAGVPAAVAGGIFFFLIGIILNPIFGALLLKFGDRSPYDP